MKKMKKIGARSRKLKNLAASTGSSGIGLMKSSPSINTLRPATQNTIPQKQQKADQKPHINLITKVVKLPCAENGV